MSDTIVAIEPKHDIIFVTVSKYELFLSYGTVGIDAYLLYSHLIYTARLQNTNSVWANNVYIRQGLKWGKEKLQKAKNLLVDLDLIEQKQDKKGHGHFDKAYIIVKTRTSPFEIEAVSTGDPDTGNPSTRLPVPDHKCLNKKKKCLNKKIKGKFIPPSPEEVQAYLDERDITSFTGIQFCSFYESKNWMVGKNKMVSWKPAVTTWVENDKKRNKEQKSLSPGYDKL